MNERSPTTVALVGIGGYGEVYSRALLDHPTARPATLVAGVDPFAERTPRGADFAAHGVPVFPSLAAMYDAVPVPELVVLSSPLHLHAEQTELALGRGSHVLCEKPMATTPDEAAAMIGARDRSGKLLAIGFQWAFSPGVQRLKGDVLAGRFGRPLRFSCRTFWPRNEAYYARNGWAGRIRSADGHVVLDSPLNNACAHHVHLMLHLLGATPDGADWPALVTAELYRAHPIENYDTVVVRCRTVGGVDLLAALSHATEREIGPTFSLQFDRGRVTSGPATDFRILGQLDGQAGTVDYGRQPAGGDDAKLSATVDAIRNGTPVACGAESAASHTALMYAAQTSGGPPAVFPECDVVVTGASPNRSVAVRGLEGVLEQCVEQHRLPSELGVPWARPARTIRVEGLTRFTPVDGGA